MDLQETLDFVVNHLRTQGEPALDRAGMGCYRTSNGKSCAVGCLIPDGSYDPSLEGRGINAASVVAALPQELRAPLHLVLLGLLQEVHDNWDTTYTDIVDALHRCVADFNRSHGTTLTVKDPEKWT